MPDYGDDSVFGTHGTLLASIAALPKRALKAGDTLVEEHSETGPLYFLASGSVEVLKDGVRIAEVGEVGAAFGEMAVLLNTRHTATVRAIEATEVYVAENPVIFFRDHPDMALYVAEILARRLDALNRYLVDVKRQFGDQNDHLAMVNGVLDTLMSKHPRRIERREESGP